MPKPILLTKGFTVIVDDEDYEWLNQWKWYVFPDGKNMYAKRKTKDATERKRQILMHRVILQHHGLLEDGLVVDHIDGDGLNNQKINLRPCTIAQNIRNRKGPFKNGYIGVVKNKRSKKSPWKAMIKINGKQIYLGVYSTKEEAARVRDSAALKYHGEFATLNFPLENKQDTDSSSVVERNKEPMRQRKKVHDE